LLKIIDNEKYFKSNFIDIITYRLF